MMPTTKVERIMAKKYASLKTQEAYSVLRTLHAQKGAYIKKALETYLYTDEAWELCEEAYVELWGIVREGAREV